MQISTVVSIALLGLINFVTASPTPTTALDERGNVICQVIPTLVVDAGDVAEEQLMAEVAIMLYFWSSTF
ncbi:hypothetical protein SUNI508_11470 [Seiridium unicorne]|uniref:Pheromone n=1 Tax=Seiridium unicorne TaxID=138068 RepID=A0ABR2UHB2_9PEZI